MKTYKNPVSLRAGFFILLVIKIDEVYGVMGSTCLNSISAIAFLNQIAISSFNYELLPKNRYANPIAVQTPTKSANNIAPTA